jgi:hypothetical protein
MKFKYAACGIALLVAGTALAAAPGLRVRLATISNGAEARWIMQEKGDHAMYLAKTVPLEVFDAAAADFSNNTTTLVGDLNYLAWNVEERTEGASVRWNIYIGPEGEDWTELIYLGEVQVGEDGQISDAEIEAAVLAAGGELTDEIKYLQIIMDEPGSVTLDDIAVTIGGTTETFSGPGNSR